MQNIIWKRPDGGVSITHVPNAEDSVEHAAILQAEKTDPSTGNTYFDEYASWTPVAFDLNPATTFPADRVFRNAWAWSTPDPVVDIDMTKAKNLCHEKRRTKRAEEFAPLDIQATIPTQATEAEAARQVIRDKYATIQTAIDSAADEAALRAAAIVVLVN